MSPYLGSSDAIMSHIQTGGFKWYNLKGLVGNVIKFHESADQACRKLKVKQISAGRHNADREKGKFVFSEWAQGRGFFFVVFS